VGSHEELLVAAIYALRNSPQQVAKAMSDFAMQDAIDSLIDLARTSLWGSAQEA
jgi:hypothetical protein